MDNEALNTIISMHIKECDGRDARNNQAFVKIENMVKGIWDAIDKNRDTDSNEKREMKKDITNLQIKAAMLVSAIIIFSKFIDYYLMIKK